MITLRQIIAATALTAACVAQGVPRVCFHDVATDTVRLNVIMAEAGRCGSVSERVVSVARRFIDVPYVGGTLDADSTESLVVNLDQLDCTTFVETVIAINNAAADRRLSWRDFLGALESVRYRSGALVDYASRLHYISDWALDNIHRGNFTEVTGLMPRTAEMTKSLDFMSTHADSYPRLVDPGQLARIKAMERNFRNHRFAYVRSADVGKPDFASVIRPGDIIAFVTRTKGLDVTHMAIVDKDSDGTVRFIHASSAAGQVLVDPLPLATYLKRRPSVMGLRIFRPR